MALNLKPTPLAAALLAVLTAPAVAQQDTQQPVRAQAMLEEIIVTARRREERLQDVPVSMTVFNQQQLENRNIFNPSDLATYTPGLNADQRFGQDNAMYAIRGFSQQQRTTATVGVYFAEVVAPRSGQNSVPSGDGTGPGDLFDLENVQVLKGPQGTLFGRNTTGGSILLVPRKPTDEFEGYVQGSLGNYDMRRLEAVINIPLHDRLRLRAGIDSNQRDGFQRNVSGVGPRDYGSTDYITGRISLVADITDDLENYTIFSITESEGIPMVPAMFACNPDGRVFAAFCQDQLARESGGFYDVGAQVENPASEIDTWRLINHTTWTVNDNLTVKNILSYSEFETSLRSPVFGTDFRIPSALPVIGGLPFKFANSRQNPGFPTADQKNFVEELQFQGVAFDDRLEWQGGLYYERSDANGLAGSLGDGNMYCPPDAFPSGDPATWTCQDVVRQLTIFANPAFGGVDPGFGVLPPVGAAGVQLGELEFESRAAYLQGSFDLTDDLKLTAGIRYTRDKSKSEASHLIHRGFPGLFLGPPALPPSCIITTATLPDCIVKNNQSSSEPTWVLGLDYSLTDDVMLYGKYTRGYRQGGINLFGAEGFQVHQPELIDAYELGAKTSFRGDVVSGTFNVAVFHNELKDQQIQMGFSSQIVTPTTGIVNAAKSEIRGVEVESAINLFGDLTLGLSYTYLDSEIKEIDVPTLPPGSVFDGIIPSALSGDPTPRTPKHSLSANLSYRLPIPDAMGEMTFGVNYVYNDKELNTAGSPFGITDSYELVDFNLNWNNIGGGQVDAAAFVTNAFKEKYVVGVPGLFNSIGAEFRTVGPPRMYGVRLKYNF